MGDFLEICQMAVQKSAPNGQEIRVPRVLNLDDTPRVLPRADLLTTRLNKVLGANDGKRQQSPQFSVLFDGVLVVLFDVVREVVDGNAVVFNVFHDEFLELGELRRGERVGLANDGDDVDARGEALHQFNVELAQTKHEVSNALARGVQPTYPCPVGVMK